MTTHICGNPSFDMLICRGCHPEVPTIGDDIDPEIQHQTQAQSRNFSKTASGHDPLFPAMVEYDREQEYLLARAENRNPGEDILLGMMTLGNAFRFVEQLFRTEQIDWKTYARAGRILCDRYESLRRDAFICHFSHALNVAVGKEKS